MTTTTKTFYFYTKIKFRKTHFSTHCAIIIRVQYFKWTQPLKRFAIPSGSFAWAQFYYTAATNETYTRFIIYLQYVWCLTFHTLPGSVCTFWCWCVGLQHFKTWFDAKIIHTEQKQVRNNYTIASIAWKIKEAWDRVATRGNDKMKTMRYILMMLIHKLRTYCEIFGVFIEWFNRNHQIDHHRNFTIKLL